MVNNYFINRDKSWLSFNERVLEEAASEKVPLLERIKFLSIFSSNLDEFYRVRMPAILALQKIEKKKDGLFSELSEIIQRQQRLFGHILDEKIITFLKELNVYFINRERVPEILFPDIRAIFFNEVAGLISPVSLSAGTSFFPENNQLYILVVLGQKDGGEVLWVVNIPTKVLPRFYSIQKEGLQYIVFLDDIICQNLPLLFPDNMVKATCNFKVTRDAEMNLTDDFEVDIALKIEKKLQKRDNGLATRFLYQPSISKENLDQVMQFFHLPKNSSVSGGDHHSYKDLFHFPLKGEEYKYPSLEALPIHLSHKTLMDEISSRDIMVHTPYHSYHTVLRFFNEAALDRNTETIYTTFYRIAADSRIAHALINAAHNGKKVFVVVELKARFDEANNLRWSKRMKEAGVKIIYSNQHIKVHAKIALIIRSNEGKQQFAGLLATGNLNENTAKIYTDHILMTTNQVMLRELYQLFEFLLRKQKPDETDTLSFKQLLVAQFNLHKEFLSLIEREITNKKKGLKAGITIKLNNLEEEKLIKKLYKASKAGVKIDMLVRSICCLRPGVIGLSENITVKRIVDRFLEHGRIFLFENAGDTEVYIGSSDWMIRNMYRRIEVCFPILDPIIRQQLIEMVQFQLNDNVQAVNIGADGENIRLKSVGKPIRSQEMIYHYLEKL
jgi:polyphosphate kinase